MPGSLCGFGGKPFKRNLVCPLWDQTFGMEKSVFITAVELCGEIRYLEWYAESCCTACGSDPANSAVSCTNDAVLTCSVPETPHCLYMEITFVPMQD